MLCITMRRGDYFTVGGETVIQLDQLGSERIHLTIQAPRDVPILRGQVLERNGGQRPECVYSKKRSAAEQIPWNSAKREALAELRRTLEQMGESPEAQAIREKLDRIFP